MQITRIGFTPLKGGRHEAYDAVRLTVDGPVGDRLFCLVDRAAGRVLRTVQHPELLRARASWDAGVLAVDLPGLTVEGSPAPTGEVLKADYWGRPAAVEVVSGPWAEAFSLYLGRDVVLARAVNAGEVVYGASVTLVTSSSVDLLGERLGVAVDSARFRSTFLVDTPGAAAHVEDGWLGRELRLGEATVLVTGSVPRCAVVDLDPATGVRDRGVLHTLAGYRRGDGEVCFGVDAVVVDPGQVRLGDVAVLERG